MASAEDQTKAQLRTLAKEFRSAGRSQFNGVVQGLAQWLVGQHLEGWVVTYDAMPGEISLAIIASHSDVPKVALTRTPDIGFDLTVHPADGQRERHRFGYTQPTADTPQILDSEISAVLVPGLVFSGQGHRLGWGAGYYDRFLGRLSEDVLRIGVSDGCLAPAIPAEPHDIPMTHIATSQGVRPVPFQI